MKKLLRRILLPFYARERHGFLMKRWWFRLVLVMYVPLVVLWGPRLWISTVQGTYDRCAARYVDKYGTTSYGIDLCNALARRAWTSPGTILTAGLTPIAFHYFAQLVLLKVIVDFVVLGSKVDSTPEGP